MDDLPTKDVLERRKLCAEIELLESQHKAGQDRSARLQIWIPAITVFCTVVTVGIQSCQYLSQQRLLHEVQIDQSLLTLAKGLSDPASKPEEREQAALLLAAYEGDAIPILLTHLRTTDDPLPVIESLRLIKDKRRVGSQKVSQKLLERAQIVFSTYSPGAGTRPYSNYVRALSELAQSESKKAVGLLIELRRKVNEAPGTEADSVLVNDEISRACQVLVRKECS